jgi:hypothetical protein
MNTLEKRGALTETIILETQEPQWVVFSIGGCGILVRAMIGRHEAKYQESQGVALAFAYHVMQAIGLSPLQERASTPQILVEAADAVINDPEHMALLCTTWQRVPEGVEICSVGSNSVLVFEKDTVREAITPHTINELLRRQGKVPSPIHRMHVTHVLGSRKYQDSCRVEDVRVALIPLLSTTTIAITEEPLLADALLEHPIPRNELFSFVEKWEYPPGRLAKRKTSVLISLQE